MRSPHTDHKYLKQGKDLTQSKYLTQSKDLTQSIGGPTEDRIADSLGGCQRFADGESGFRRRNVFPDLLHLLIENLSAIKKK